MARNAMERNGMERNGTERNELEPNGMEWRGTLVNGMEPNAMDHVAEYGGVVLVSYSDAFSQAPAAGPGLRVAGEPVVVVAVAVVAVGV